MLCGGLALSLMSVPLGCQAILCKLDVPDWGWLLCKLDVPDWGWLTSIKTGGAGLMQTGQGPC